MIYVFEQIRKHGGVLWLPSSPGGTPLAVRAKRSDLQLGTIRRIPERGSDRYRFSES